MSDIVATLRAKFSTIPHTPTPWVMDEQWTGLAFKPEAGARRTIFKVTGQKAQDIADAVFVLDAINAHDELVAALEQLCQIMGYGIDDTAWLDAHKAALAALAKARGES